MTTHEDLDSYSIKQAEHPLTANSHGTHRSLTGYQTPLPPTGSHPVDVLEPVLEPQWSAEQVGIATAATLAWTLQPLFESRKHYKSREAAIEGVAIRVGSALLGLRKEILETGPCFSDFAGACGVSREIIRRRADEFAAAFRLTTYVKKPRERGRKGADPCPG